MADIGEVRFYQLQRQPLEAALPRLLEKLYERGMRAMVRLPDPLMLETMDRALWAYDPDSFLPHGAAGCEAPDKQPIYLTTGEERPNGAEVLVLVNGVAAPEPLGDFTLCLYMFDGNDEAVLGRAREDWQRFRDRATRLDYWAQKKGGGWEKAG